MWRFPMDPNSRVTLSMTLIKMIACFRTQLHLWNHMPSKSFASLKPMAIPKQQPPHQYRKSRQKCHGNSHQKLLRLGEEDTRIHTADSKQPPQPSNNPSSNLDQQHQQHQQLVISKTLVLLLVTAQSLLLLLISSQQVVVVVEAQNAVYRPYR